MRPVLAKVNASFVQLMRRAANASCDPSVPRVVRPTSHCGCLRILSSLFALTAVSAGCTGSRTPTNPTPPTQSCTFSLSPPGPSSFPPVAGTASITITTTTGCSWSATSNAGWLTITGASNGSGTGQTNFSAATNTATSERTGTISVAGQTVTVNQSGASSAPAGRSYGDD